MKRCVFYLLILAVVFVIPVERTDVGKLQPVQTVAVSYNGGRYVIATDTGGKGEGINLPAALEDLANTTPAILYLDTAEFLLVSENAVEAVEELRQYLKNRVEIYYFSGNPNLEDVSKYLSVHGTGTKLKDWKIGDKLPVLNVRNDRIEILSKKK